MVKRSDSLTFGARLVCSLRCSGPASLYCLLRCWDTVLPNLILKYLDRIASCFWTLDGTPLKVVTLNEVGLVFPLSWLSCPLWKLSVINCSKLHPLPLPSALISTFPGRLLRCLRCSSLQSLITWVYFSDVSLSFHLLSRWAWHLLGTRVEPAKWPATESWSKWRKGARRTSTWSGKLDRRSEVLQLWTLVFLIIKGTEHQKVETQKEDREKTSILKNTDCNCSSQFLCSRFLGKISVDNDLWAIVATQ